MRFGRKCVGYFGAVTWAGGLREAPGPSQPRVRAPPEPPITASPCQCDAPSPRPPDAGISGLGGLPSPSRPLQLLQPSSLDLTQSVGGSLCRWPEGHLETQ